MSDDFRAAWIKAADDRDRLTAELAQARTSLYANADARLEAEAEVTRLTAQWEALKAWHLNQAEVWEAAGSPEHAATHHAAIKSMTELEAQR